MILLPLALLSLPLAVSIPCLKPKPVSFFPPALYDVGGTPGANDLISCSKYYVGQLGSGTKVFSSGGSFTCDKTTGKWTNSDGYEAPPFLSCASGSPNYCAILDTQPSGSVSKIAIYPGNEQYCPTGHTLMYADGRSITSILCKDYKLGIISGGALATSDTNNPPKLKCQPDGCPFTLTQSNGKIENATVRVGAQVNCPKGEILEFISPKTGATIKGMNCTEKGIVIYSPNGDVLNIPKPASLSVQCKLPVPPKCPLPKPVNSTEFPPPLVQGDAAVQWKDEFGYDWFECAKYSVGKMYANSKTFTTRRPFRCDSTNLKWIRPSDGFEAPPFLSCAVDVAGTLKSCPILMSQSGGTNALVDIYTGKEQICETGKTLAFSNGIGIKSITCTGTDLRIVSGDGTNKTYAKPVLKCEIRSCPITIKLPSGEFFDDILPPGMPFVCPKGETILYDDESAKSMTCKALGLEVEFTNGDINTFSKNSPFSFECFGRTCNPLPDIPTNLIPTEFKLSTFGPFGSPLFPYTCREQFALAQYEKTGPVVLMASEFACNNGKWSIVDSERIPYSMSCVKPPANDQCWIVYVSVEGTSTIQTIGPDHKYCPDHQKSILSDGTVFTSLKCNGPKKYNVTLADGTVIHKEARVQYLEVSCGVPPTCHLPEEVNKLEFPTALVYVGPLDISTGYSFKCENFMVAKMDDGSKTFSTGGEFHCNSATEKWTRADDNFEAPPYMSCANKKYVNLDYCTIYLQQATGGNGSVALYSGNEQICENGLALSFVSGTRIKNITCTGKKLSIAPENGPVQSYEFPSAPSLKCAPAFPACPFPSPVPVAQIPKSMKKSGEPSTRNDGVNDLISCGTYIGQYGNGSKAFAYGGPEYECDATTGKWKYPGGGYEAPDFLSCGTYTDNNYCATYDEQASGALGFIAIFPDKEQYCRTGEALQFSNGTAIADIQCYNNKLTIVTKYGHGTYYPNSVDAPKLKCGSDPAPSKELPKFLVQDTPYIAAGLNVTFDQWYPYFLQADQEVHFLKQVNETTAILYVRMVLTICKKDAAGLATVKEHPEQCTPLPEGQIKEPLKRYQYVKLIQTNTTTPTKTTFYKGYALGSLAALTQEADKDLLP